MAAKQCYLSDEMQCKKPLINLALDIDICSDQVCIFAEEIPGMSNSKSLSRLADVAFY